MSIKLIVDYFSLSENNTKLKIETLAGITTFIECSMGIVRLGRKGFASIVMVVLFFGGAILIALMGIIGVGFKSGDT